MTDHNNKDYLVFPLVCILALVIIFLVIINSGMYYDACAVDSLPLGFIVLFIMFPIAIITVIISSVAGYKLFKVGKSNLAITAILIGILSVVIVWKGFDIYEVCMSKAANLLSTDFILKKDSKLIKHFSNKVLANSKRQSELLSILNSKGDTLSSDELWKVLYHLRRNNDPIVLRYAIKLAKMNIPKGHVYYAFPMELVINRTDARGSQEVEELKDFANRTIGNQKEIDAFYRLLKYWQSQKKN